MFGLTHEALRQALGAYYSTKAGLAVEGRRFFGLNESEIDGKPNVGRSIRKYFCDAAPIYGSRLWPITRGYDLWLPCLLVCFA